MRFPLKIAALVVTVAAHPLSVAAQPFTIVDSIGQIIGDPVDLYDVAINYSRLGSPALGPWFSLNFDRDGFHNNALFLFVEPSSFGCVGTKYLSRAVATPRLAVYDGQQFWAEQVRLEEQLHIASFSWGGACYDNDPTYPEPVAPAMVIDGSPNRWVPPFGTR